MKFSLEQHEEMRENSWRTYNERREQLNRMLEHLEQDRQRLLKYDQQIAEAKRRGLDGFDPDRFMQRKKKK